jgi:hypothetical protein
MEKELHVDAGRIHVADTPFADIRHPLAHVDAAFAHSETVTARHRLSKPGSFDDPSLSIF